MPTKATKTPTSRTRARAVHDPIKHGVANGYRSGLEDKIAKELVAKGVEFEFESFSLPFTPPIKTRRYTPDFRLPNGIVIETKGQFKTDDRQKHKNVKAEHPDLDIRFVFSNERAKLSKGSPTTYAKWCEDYGFLYASKSIPDEWINEPPCERRIAALARAAIPKKSKK